jgi:YidC/Oxa1 family membrane protein insertase
LFVGAKVLRTLDGYEEKLGFSKFDLAVDFGWFYFLTKPLFYLLEYLHKILGNLGLAILVMTVMFKVVLFPLANKSYRSMSRMKTLQPKMEALKQRFGTDKMRMNQEIMELYKKEQINPLSGCLPMVIQAPLFFCLYKVLFVTIEMRHAPFYGWIHDLSAPDPTSFFNLFGLLPFDPPSFLMIGAWPLLMGLTMFLQQKMNPQPADPAQATMFMIMPVMMTFLLASFPAGLVIYWAWNNILSIAQQWYIMRLEANRTPGSKNTPRNIS